MSVNTLHVRLLNEEAAVWRPAPVAPLEGGLFKILPPDHYDPEDEEWEFPPGSIVACKETITDDGYEILVACEPESPADLQGTTEGAGAESHTSENLLGEFADRFIERHGVQMLNATDALDLITKAKEAHIPILGFYAFWVGPDSVEPSVEHSHDFSGGESDGPAEEAHDQALEMIQAKRRLGLFFDIVV